MGLYDQNQSAQDELQKLREGASHSRAAQKIAQRDYAKAQAEADKWEQRYQLALKADNQDLISKAKFQKERYQAIASRLKILVEDQQPQVDAIKSNLTSWETKVSEAQNEDIDILADDELQLLKQVLFVTPDFQEQTQDKKDAKLLLSEAINEIEQVVTDAVANQDNIQKDFKKAQIEAKYWNEKAQTALKNNDDDLALKAVANKKIKNEIALTIQTQLQQQETTINLLIQNLILLEKLREKLGIAQHQDSIPDTQQTSTSSSSMVNNELEELRKQLDEL
ncbi:PspA/IM30 family protein [Cylindrospermum sp. FACHB-282]|uniref:PspA/IM30 family protein n=1 Tax=Cylindrospermum sp. FACHB-282 TaxID=2692794 RepID=UPI0016825266|nr:PspA/IM30 family protein [Cylindrospermum sp. FACHB-282]MBD2384269.1 PspA/IM30 family protein [Cylindrospermum sp. FACHB-282]